MEKKIIILNLFNQRNQKIVNIYESDFDILFIKEYLMSFNRLNEDNLKEFKRRYYFIINEDVNGKKQIYIKNGLENELNKYDIQTKIFNYYEHYFTFIDSKELKLNDKKIDDLNGLKLNYIENLLLKYYKCIIKIFMKKDFEKIKSNEKKEFEDEIEKIRKKEDEVERQIQSLFDIKDFKIEKLIQFLISKLNLFIIENNLIDYPKSFSLRLLIFDNCVKNAIMNEKVKKLITTSIKDYIKKYTTSDQKIYQFIFRIYYFDKIFLNNISPKIINNLNLNVDNLFNSIENTKKKILRDYILIYKDKLPNQDVHDNIINIEALKKKINEFKNETEFCNKLKRTEFNIFIEKKLFSKGFLLVCLNVFKKLVYPLDMSLSFLILIYNGLICENYHKEELINVKNIIIRTGLFSKKKIASPYKALKGLKINIDSLDFIENNDDSFKTIIFHNFLNDLSLNYNIFKIQKLTNFPIFHLVIHKIFLWKINLETNKKNFNEAIITFRIFKSMAIKLSCNIINDDIIKIYSLIFEIIGDIYFNKKYYRMAKRTYSSAIRKIHEIETENKFKSLYIALRNKVIISKYFSGYKIRKIK